MYRTGRPLRILSENDEYFLGYPVLVFGAVDHVNLPLDPRPALSPLPCPLLVGGRCPNCVPSAPLRGGPPTLALLGGAPNLWSSLCVLVEELLHVVQVQVKLLSGHDPVAPRVDDPVSALVVGMNVPEPVTSPRQGPTS